MGLLDEMQRIVVHPPITHEGACDLIATIPIFEKMHYMGDPALKEFLNPTSQAEFCISGTTYTFTPILTSPVAKQHYLYIRSLSIMSMDRQYYTHRYCDDSFLLLYTLSGKGWMEYEGKQILLRSGDGVWIDCTQEHQYRTVGEEWTHVVLHFCGASANAWYEEYTAGHPSNFHQKPGGTFHQTLEQVIRDYGKLSFGREIRIANGLSNLLTTLITDTDADRFAQEDLLTNLQKVITYLEHHLSEPISLDQLASLTCISKYHLAHEFQRFTGYSPIEYLIHLRINQACFLLQTTRLPINRIAELVGIPNNQYFGKLFKKKAGLTPGQYRKTAKAPEPRQGKRDQEKRIMLRTNHL